MNKSHTEHHSNKDSSKEELHDSKKEEIHKYAEHIKEDLDRAEKLREHPKKSFLSNISIFGVVKTILLIALILFIAILSLSVQLTVSSTTQNSLKNVSVVREGFADISLTRYLNNTNYPITFSEITYITQETIKSESSSTIRKYVEDDSGNRIELYLGMNAGILYNSLFHEGQSKETYLVNGTIQLINSKPTLSVTSITQKNRELINRTYIEEQYSPTVGQAKTQFSINLTRGISTITGK